MTASEVRSGGAVTARQRGRGADASPRAVTRGERSGSSSRASVDWLNVTFPAPSMTIEGFISMLGRLLGRPVSGDEGGGIFGFESAVQLMAHVGSRRAAMGFLAMGGESQAGRWLLQLTGSGCELVPDWEALREFLEGLGGRITRLDLAVDFLDGEHTVDDAVEMHAAGLFAAGGRPPSTEVAGDWLERKSGRTLYVGKAKNGKTLRVYEKGKQLGNAESPWVRFEVQLGNRDRVIPFEALTERDRYFAGCYPALAELIEDAAERIRTVQTGGEVSLAHLLHHLKRCYGKVLDVAHAVCGVDYAELVEEVRIVGVPRRLKVSSLAAGLTWAQVLAQLKS